MPLNPQVQAFLDLGAKANLPDISEQGPFMARSNSHAEPDISGPIESGARIDHKYFTSPTADLPVHIYTPEGEGPFNALVYFHGGGWVVNYVSKYDAQLVALAKKTNSVIVSVNYQKAPEHKFPIPFDDCYAGLEWTIANAAVLNIDVTKIGVGGDSAGGNLASAVALAARDRGKIPLAYQLLVYPCNSPDFVANSSVPNADGYGLTQRGMKWLWEQYLNGDSDNLNPYAVPHAAKSFAGLPPTVIITAEFDVLREDGMAYSQKLIDAGVEVVYRDMLGMIHGFFNYGKYVDEGIAVREYFASEINRILSK
ncbi:MAG: alpha/beta hydrolase [Actinobacteria bacterium]|nr:alpha/beta hydrolase [Actinomycetota bacterium]